MALSTAAPILFAWMLSRGHLRLCIDRRSATLLAFALGFLVGASQIGQPRLLVPAALIVGTAALRRIVYATTRSRPVTALAVCGAVSNVIPVAVTGAMPVSARVRALVSDVPISEGAIVSVKHNETDPGWWLIVFSDVIPVPFIHAVISVGDVLLIAALVWTGRICLKRSTRPVTAEQRDRRVSSHQSLLTLTERAR